jgi:general secretion pathway protein F
MATFRYTATNLSGKTVKGILDADSERLAISALRSKKLVPLQIAASSVDSSGHAGNASLRHVARVFEAWSRPSQATVAAVVRQLATLLRAGLPLDEALGSLCAHEDNSRMKEVLAQIRDSILVGNTFADSIAAFPLIFSPTFATMIRAGEESGTLDLVIERFATHIEERIALIRKVQSTLAYPVLMLVMGSGVIIFLLAYIVPKMTKIFADMGRSLPLPTQILLTISDGIRSGWWIGLLFLFVGFVLLSRIRCSPHGKKKLQSLLLRCPGLRNVYRPLLVGHMTRTLGMLLKNGVSLLKALHIVKSVSQNIHVIESVQQLIDGVQEGHDISTFMTNPELFPPLARQMVAAGEKSGQLDEMLLWVASYCESKVTAYLQVVTSLLEPIMILILGGIVGFVVIAIILPIFEISNFVG